MKTQFSSDNPPLDEINEVFGHDRYATVATGCVIKEGWRGHAVASMELGPTHQNAQGHIMGGAIFTLADYALAIACNIGRPPTVCISANIDYLTATSGKVLTATADCSKEGSKVSYFDIVVTDDMDNVIAKVHSVVYSIT